MNSGGGDHQSPPCNGGEFLLNLLRRAPHNQPPPPNPHQHSAASHDPAVAAVGPTVRRIQSNGHDLPHHHYSQPPPPFAPHAYFQGYSSNPNPNSDARVSSSPPLADSFRNLGLSGPISRPEHRNSTRSSSYAPGTNTNGLRASESTLPGEGNWPLKRFENHFYGSPNSSGSHRGNQLPQERTTGEGNRRLDGFKHEIPDFPNSGRNIGKNVIGDRNMAMNGFDGDFRNSPSYSRSPGMISRGEPPPGYVKKLGNRSLWRNVDKEKSSLNGWRDSGVNSNQNHSKEKRVLPERRNDQSGKIAERRLSSQLDSPGLPTGSTLHSNLGIEVEESLSELHGEKIPGNYDQVVGLLEEENGSSVRKNKKRDKDCRSDTRGNCVLAQRMRTYRRQIACRSDIDIFNAPLIAIYESLIPPEEEKINQKRVLALLEKLVTEEWPEARLFVYGSCANSFGVSKSDIDICLAIEDADDNKAKVLLRLADILKSENFEKVQALTHARVPIVKLMDPGTGISCDICINNLLAVVNSKLLRDYANIDERLRQLAFIVKHWAKSRGVNETYHGTLSSYAYVLMCIHFLQQRRPAILPCLQGMDITYAVTVDNVECAFFDQVDNLAGFGSCNRESIAQLVWAFFRYWAYCHDYAHDVVSVRTGSIISKRGKDWTKRVGNDRHLICIEDPFEITHDLGRVVDKYSIKVLREEFERAAEILQYDQNPCVTLFEPYIPS